jgi:hypothetical protein
VRRRIGILAGLAENDLEAQTRMAAFVLGLGELGWTRGRNVQIEIRWAGALTEDLRRFAAELVRRTPDVLMATGGASLGPLVEVTQTIPIVFAPDPLGSGFYRSAYANRPRRRGDRIGTVGRLCVCVLCPGWTDRGEDGVGTGEDDPAVISRVEIPQCSSLLPLECAIFSVGTTGGTEP